jgi:hypothetical protein
MAHLCGVLAIASLLFLSSWAMESNIARSGQSPGSLKSSFLNIFSALFTLSVSVKEIGRQRRQKPRSRF